ncbi:MAG TPA: hypothetical protein V6D47_14045 [Oscillatoriaceae cyanobacterium]
MEIVITGWGLRSYLKLLDEGRFTEEEYWGQMRPDILMLYDLGNPKFHLGKFWSPAATQGLTVQSGWKMKWHNMGPGGAQRRLPVLLFEGDAFLCEAYVKVSDYADARGIARFSAQAVNIRKGSYEDCGRLR